MERRQGRSFSAEKKILLPGLSQQEVPVREKTITKGGKRVRRAAWGGPTRFQKTKRCSNITAKKNPKRRTKAGERPDSRRTSNKASVGEGGESGSQRIAMPCSCRARRINQKKMTRETWHLVRTPHQTRAGAWGGTERKKRRTMAAGDKIRFWEKNFPGGSKETGGAVLRNHGNRITINQSQPRVRDE